MTQPSVASRIEHQVRRQAASSVAGVFLLPVACAAALGAIAASFTGAPVWQGVAAFAVLASLPAGWAAWRTMRRHRQLLEGRQALLIQRWLDATRDPVEAARRRQLYLEKGIAGTLPLLGEDWARDVEVQRGVKKGLRGRAAARAGASVDSTGSGLLTGAGMSGLSSGSGLPTNEAGLDMYGDGPGSTVNRDFFLPAHNPNTEAWTSEGTYDKPH